MNNFFIKYKAKVFSKILIGVGIVLVLITFLPYVGQEVWYQFVKFKHQRYVLADKNSNFSVFGQLLSKKDIVLKPINTDFSLVIEKIGLNVPVVMGVSVADEAKYIAALKNGVAHAIVSDLPSAEPGNVYLFAHSSFNFFSLGKYATAFNLLKKLEVGDTANVFYHNKRYIYEVVNKQVLPGWNTYPLTRPVLEPLLTLQTCDPPGTTLNRLIVTAKLKEIK